MSRRGKRLIVRWSTICTRQLWLDTTKKHKRHINVVKHRNQEVHHKQGYKVGIMGKYRFGGNHEDVPQF